MTDRTMTLDGGKLPMQMDRVDEILNSAEIGIYRIIMRKGEHPRLQGSAKLRELLGVDKDCSFTEEEFYDYWYSHIAPADVLSKGTSLEDIFDHDHFDSTYRWNHPTLGLRYARCGGVVSVKEDGTRVMEGYHQDFTEQMERTMQDELVVKSLANIYSCLFYVDMDTEQYTSYVNTLHVITKYIPRTGNVRDAMKVFNEQLCKPCDRSALEAFNDLSTIDERLRFNSVVRIHFQSTIYDWVRLAFIVCDRHSDGSVKSMVVAVKDVSEMKEMERERMEELKQNIRANRSKTQMLQNMTHEIRTPLNAMFGFSQLLCMPDGYVSETQKHEYFNYIFNSFNMLSMLIDDVLDVADAEHGNYRVEKGRFAVNEMCRNAILMADMRRHANVKMYFTSDVADDYFIESDSRRIQQVLVNFLTNACKHTVQGEIHLHLSTTETPGRLTFSVTDTGTGIPPEMAKDIFERYRKADCNVQGSGLGLHICSIIADRLGAEVKLDQTYTQGARFLFIL